jgi:hypothetical protein
MASFRWYGADVVVKMPGGVFLGGVGFASCLRDYYVADAWPCRRLGCRLSCPVDSDSMIFFATMHDGITTRLGCPARQPHGPPRCGQVRGIMVYSTPTPVGSGLNNADWQLFY